MLPQINTTFILYINDIMMLNITYVLDFTVELIHKVSKKIRWLSISNKFFNQGLVLDGRPNLKLFNQLYWLITLAFVVVGHVVYPLPQLISGTFPAQSRYR